MSVEYETSVAIFNSLVHVMGMLRRHAIVLEKRHGVKRITLDALPVFADRPCAFSFVLDAELAMATTEGQFALRLAVDIELRGEENYAAVGAIGWETADEIGTATASPWGYLDCPETQSADALEFFERVLPNYTETLIAKHEQAFREFLGVTQGR